MLREEQIDIRKQRAKAGKFQIENLGKNRVHSDFRVTNPDSGGKYTVSIRGFDTGDNACTCPDFKSNTLGTCKHIEAVVEHLREELPPHLQKKKAAITRPEIALNYAGDQLRLELHLPPRHSDKLARLAAVYFDEHGLWTGRGQYRDLIRDVEAVPEEVTFKSDALDFTDREIERGEMLTREAEWLKQLDAGTLDLKLLTVPLYDYQTRGALFLACRGRSILGDDMGLGKTVQTLAGIELLARERGVQRVLVVAPASVKYQWEGEIRKFTGRPVQVIEGGPDDRRDQYTQPTFYRLVNYEQVVRDRDAINDWKPDVVVLDEAQRIKNWEAKTTRAVKKLQSRYAIVLTGTPIENRLEELYSIVQFVDERRFGPAFQFLHEHRVLDENGNLKGYRNLEKIREKLGPIFLRRTRPEVLTQLPPRTDNTVFVELAPEQRGPYEEQRISLARLLQKNYLTDLDRKRILASVVNMRTICDSLFLFDRQSRVSPKLDEFAELVPELVGDTGRTRSVSDGVVLNPSPPLRGRGQAALRGAGEGLSGRTQSVSDGVKSEDPSPGDEASPPSPRQSPGRGVETHPVADAPGSPEPMHKLVVFSQWETMILEAAKVLDTLGVNYTVLHGGLSGPARKEVMEKFKNDPACTVFLSTDAGGTGLNLQVADTVVNLELPWNPAVLEQRIARVHRMGQSRPVRVVNFVTRGTIEEKVLRTIEAKQGLFAGVFESDADEIPFAAVNATGFLNTMRELVDEGGAEQEPGARRQESVRNQPDGPLAPGPRVLTPTPAAAGELALWHGVAQLLEAACATLADSTARGTITKEIRDRMKQAAWTIATRLGGETG